jgi:hypothetical protein
MSRSIATSRLQDVVTDVTEQSIRCHGIPPEVAEYAAGATLSALQGAEVKGLRRRAERYFHAVARRELLRSGGHATASARVVADSVVADLMASGRSPRDVWDELDRGWSGAFPGEVLEEYRRVLCA